MKALPVQEFRRLDLNSGELGVPVAKLMANAGKALARAVARRLPKGGEALFLCGKGNNGGDGVAAAALLHRQGKAVRVVLAEGTLRGPGRAFLQQVPADLVERWNGRNRVPRRGVLVDCLLGSGLEGTPRRPYDAAIRFVNRHRARLTVVSCDVPSGFGSPLAVRPHATVTFHAAKEGMAPASCGRIEVAGIGIPHRAAEVGLGDLDLGYPRPAPTSHKGDNGVILLVAGSIPFTGAPFYAGMAAYRTGADLVHAVLPEQAAAAVRAYGPEIMVHAFEPGNRLTEASLPGILDIMGRCTALAIGPGLGTAEETRIAMRQVLEAAADRSLPTVVDADGLDAVTERLLRRHGPRMVLTPHAREFRDLAGVEATPRNVAAYARRNGVTVLRKGEVDAIADATRTRASRGGHPAMTVGGTGDVLTGAVAGLLAKGAPPFEAACAASYLVKRAGENAASLLSYGATATDVLHAIPSVLLRLP